MVPPGIPGRSDRDVLPDHDPESARALLADAGFPGGQGFPEVTLLTGGSPYDEAVVERDQARARRDAAAPRSWTSGRTSTGSTTTRRRCGSCRGSPTTRAATTSWACCWGPGSTNNYGRWSSDEFDAAIAEAGATTDEAAAAAAYDRAEDIVQRDAPVVPITYGTGWALARDGLLGAGQNGLGALRFAGLAWAQP